MTDLLVTPMAQLGFTLLGISPPPPFPAAFDEHIATWERAEVRARSVGADADHVLWRMTSRNEGPAIAACETRLTGQDGPLLNLDRLSADCRATSVTLRILKIVSTSTWTAIALFAAAVGAATGFALVTGAAMPLTGFLPRALQMIRQALQRLRTILEKLFRSLLDRIVGRQYLDLHSAEMTSKFAVASHYRKQAIVQVRDAVPGEKVQTVLNRGWRKIKETKNEAKAGDKVITNPREEQYLVSPQKYVDRYDDLGGGRAEAKGMAMAFPNPTGKPILIKSPWGEEMRGDADSWLMMAVDPKDPRKMTGDRYLIGGKEFRDDYGETVIP